MTNAGNDFKNNHLDVVHAIAIFNEPNISGSTQAQSINHVWTQTYKVIRSILPEVKIMGPNYEDYRRSLLRATRR